MVSDRRPDLTHRQCDLLAWSTMAAVMSISFQRVRLPRTEYDKLLADIIETIMDIRLLREAAAAPEETREHDAPGRRGALLAVAARLFAARGYHSVTIDDIGAAVGIAGTSVYRHFPAKLDLMLAIMADGAQQMHNDMARILAEQTSETAVRALLSAYSTYSLSNNDVIELLITETIHLPEPHRSTYLGVQRRYIDTWLQLLSDLDPTRPPEHARVRLQAAFNLINDISRTTHLRIQATTATAVQMMGYALPCFLGLRTPSGRRSRQRRGTARNSSAGFGDIPHRSEREIMQGFKNFLMRGDVIVVAVGLVIALAFSALITAFTTDIINPIVARFQGGSSIGLGVQLGAKNNAKTFLDLGSFISAIIYFVIFITVVYFLIVTPYKRVQARRGQAVFGDPPPVKTCPACLSSDLPAAASKCKYCGTDQPAVAR